jgi:hypothetical protein
MFNLNNFYRARYFKTGATKINEHRLVLVLITGVLLEFYKDAIITGVLH